MRGEREAGREERGNWEGEVIKGRERGGREEEGRRGKEGGARSRRRGKRMWGGETGGAVDIEIVKYERGQLGA